MKRRSRADHCHRPTDICGLWSPTRHATRRLAQRCVSEDVVALVLDFGSSQSARDGCRRYWLPRKSAADALDAGAPLQDVERALNLVMIESGDARIVTAYPCAAPGPRRRSAGAGGARRAPRNRRTAPRANR